MIRNFLLRSCFVLIVAISAGYSGQVYASYKICLTKQVSSDGIAWADANSQQDAVNIVDNAYFKFIVEKCPSDPGGLKNITLSDPLLGVSESLGDLPHSHTDFPVNEFVQEAPSFCSGKSGYVKNVASVSASIFTNAETRTATDSAWVHCEDLSTVPVINIIEGTGPYPSQEKYAELVISTDVESECRGSIYGNGEFDAWTKVFESADNLTHKVVIPIGGDANQSRFIRCRNLSTGATNESNTEFPIYFYKSSVLSKVYNLIADKPMNDDGNFTLSWDSVEGASFYYISERVNDNYSKPVSFISGQTSIQLSRPENARYEYTVSACTDETGASCGVFSYKTIVSVGSDPTHFPPEISIVSGSGPYPPGARNMEMVISTNLDAECRHSGSDSGYFQYWNHTFSTTDKRTHRLDAQINGSYNQYKFIRCKALDTGYYHDQSFRFNIYFQDYDLLASPNDFIADSPMNLDGDFTLSWSSVNGASRYHLMEQFNDGNWYPVTLVPDQSYISLSRPTEGRYVYMVAACSDEQPENCGQFSPQVVVSVGADSSHFPPEMSYVSGSGPYPYKTSSAPIVISTNIDAQCRARASDQGKYENWWIDLSTTDNRIHNIEAMTHGDHDLTYYFRCKALNTGYTNEVSLPVTIEIITKADLTVPTNFALEDSDNQGNFTFSWTPVENAVAYRLKHAIGNEDYTNTYFDASDSPSSFSFYRNANGDYRFYLAACPNIHGQECTSHAGPIAITVSDAGSLNSAPQITSDPNYSAIELAEYNYAVIATDPDTGDNLTFALINEPQGMSIDSNSGLISWTPTAAQVGYVSFSVIVTDQDGLSDEQQVNVGVYTTDMSPRIKSSPLLNAQSGQPYTYDVNAVDPDSGDTISYSLTTSPTGMTINPGNGVISWTPANNQGGGNHSVTVVATDDTSKTDSQTFIISVSGGNSAPQITSTPNMSATELVAYSYLVTATDPDMDDTLSFSLLSAPSGMSIGESSGSISWTPSSSQTGSQSVTVVVTDSEGLEDSQGFAINVENVNQAPTITSTPQPVARENELYTYQVTIDDPDTEDIHTYQIEGASGGISIDETTGLLSWTPNSQQLGVHTFELKVLDSNGGSTSQQISIAVATFDGAPRIWSTPVLNAEVGVRYAYDVEATDAESGNTIAHRLENAPASMTIVESYGLIFWTPEPTDVGDHTVRIVVTDPENLTDVQEFTLTVVDPQPSPAITSSPVTTANVNVSYQYAVTATDPYDANLVFSLTEFPNSMTIDPVSGLISWIPNESQLGDRLVTVIVTDSDGLTDSQTFSINVSSELDSDGDGVVDSQDAFPNDPNESVDTDSDGIGNNADTDDDNDGVLDPEDAFPLDATESVDTDSDGVGNNADTDDDNDGVLDPEDAFPLDVTESVDTDSDGVGNNTDTDDDNDGVLDPEDAFPLDATESVDTDSDGVGNNADTDDDNDGVLDSEDAFPLDATESVDTDSDGVGNNADTDDDNDGVLDPEDAFPLDAAESSDIDGDGIGDNADTDKDGDGVDNGADVYPEDLNRSTLESVISLQAQQDNEFVNLSWGNISEGTQISGYHLDRAVSGQSFERIYSINLENFVGQNIEYVDEQVINKTAYQYRVISYSLLTDENGQQFESQAGNQVELFVAYNNDVIQSLNLNVVNQQPVINWSSVDADEYVVYRGQEGTDATPISVITEATFTDSNTIVSNNYYYQIANRKLFTNPMTSESFSIDGPLSGQLSYYQAQSLEIQIPGANQTAETEFELVKANTENVSVEITHRNFEGPVSVVITNGAETFNQDNTTGVAVFELPVDAAVWTISSEVNNDNVIQTASAILTISVDSAEPQLTINGPLTIDSNESTYTFTGTVTDDNGVSELLVISSLQENTQFKASLDESSFSVEIPLSIGENLVTFTASDIAGNESTATRTVNKEDRLTPQIEITSHNDNQTVSTENIDLIGRIQSELPSKDIEVRLGQTTAALTPNQDGSYGFKFENLLLVEGQNNLKIIADSNNGSDSVDITISYQAEADLTPASLEISSPLSGMTVSQSDFVVNGRITGSHLSTLTVNGQPLHLIQTGTDTQSFNYLASFAENSAAITLAFVGMQGGEIVINDTHSYYLDNSAPIIAINTALQPSPTLNEVKQNPFKIEGTVTDDNISALFINEQQVSLVPGEGVNEYQFTAALQLESGVELDVELKAQDMSSNITTESIRIVSNTTAEIDLIAPTGNKDFIITDTNFNLKVLARVTGLQGGETVRAFVDGANQVPLAITESLVNGDLLFTASSGTHEVKVQIVASDGEVVSSTTREFNLIDPADIPLEMAKTQPFNGEQYAEPNGFIGLYFSKAIDPALLSVEVYETANGKTYIKDDEPGANMFEAKGYQLKDISRSNELVPGGLSSVPGDSMYAYYMERDLAYGANVIVKVNYDGEEFHRFAYQVRDLPTFVSGAVYDQLEQPVAGIKVTLQNRDTMTTRDGSFAFGFGDEADNQLKPGLHKLTINQDFYNSKFGVVHKYINVEAHRRNQQRLIKTPVLDNQNPFVPVQSGAVLDLIGGELQLDLTNATMTFPDGNTSGNIQMSFLEINDTVGEATRAAIPFWVFASQPSGVTVSGQVGLRMKLPKVYNNYDYVPDNGKLMVLVGRPNNSNAIIPIGVGEVDGIYLNSVGNLQLENLDYIGFAFTDEKNQEKLRKFANGEMSLQLLIAYLQQ